ncbi:MAG TPA: MBL fold metallo-hydrolase [Polyangia bacterium]|nr:MBL fold metallo-hydrolase [Polyangia bacterium]
MKGFLIFLIVLTVIVGAFAVVLRVGRGKSDSPHEVKPGFSTITNMGGVYIFSARVGTKVVLFDAGADPFARPIDALLSGMQAGRQDVSDIFITHGHMDHIAGAPSFPRARVHLGAGDVGMAAGKSLPDALMGKLMVKLAPIPPLTQVNDPLSGKTTVTVAEGKTVKAFPVPGHTPGSFAFLYDEVLIPGDIMVFKQGHLEPTPALFDAHPEENKAAIRSLKTQLEGETFEYVCTAHGGCTPKGLGRILLDDLIKRVGG